MSALKLKLIDEYGGFSDKRIKDIEKGSSFIVDDRSKKDIGANKKLLSYFCSIFAEVLSEDEIEVTLRGNVPINNKLKGFIANGNNCQFTDGDDKSLAFKINKGNIEALNVLAYHIKAIVGPQAPRYDTPSYKYVCPRTADSLDRLSSALKAIWLT